MHITIVRVHTEGLIALNTVATTLNPFLPRNFDLQTFFLFFSFFCQFILFFIFIFIFFDKIPQHFPRILAFPFKLSHINGQDE
jgi:hypothetical protein